MLVEHLVFIRLIRQVFYSAPLKVYEFAKDTVLRVKGSSAASGLHEQVNDQLV